MEQEKVGETAGVAIRPWQRGDLETLRAITWQSWVATYSSFVPEGDLKAYFDIFYTEDALERIFEDPSSRGYVAEDESGLIGYARTFFNREEKRLYVTSLYLVPGREGKGIGRRLLREAEERAAEVRADSLWIGVMVQNRGALHFYLKVGFRFVREEPFKMGQSTVSHLIGYKPVVSG